MHTRSLAIALAMVGLTLGGCTATTSRSNGNVAFAAAGTMPDELRWGLTLADLRALTADADEEVSLLHHFTIRDGSAVVQCVSGALHGTTYYFLLRDDALDRVVPARREGISVYLAKEIDPFALSANLLKREGLTIEQWRERVARDHAREQRTDGAKEPLGILNFFPKRSSDQLKERSRFVALARQFDGAAIPLGVDPADVQRIVGGAHRFALDTALGSRVFIYGRDAEVGAWWAIPWLFVEYADGNVIAVRTWWSAESPPIEVASSSKGGSTKLDEAEVLRIARGAVGRNDTWVESAEFEAPKRGADGSWRVLVWRLPQTPGGYRSILIDEHGNVTEYIRGR